MGQESSPRWQAVFMIVSGGILTPLATVVLQLIGPVKPLSGFSLAYFVQWLAISAVLALVFNSYFICEMRRRNLRNKYRLIAKGYDDDEGSSLEDYTLAHVMASELAQQGLFPTLSLGYAPAIQKAMANHLIAAVRISGVRAAKDLVETWTKEDEKRRGTSQPDCSGDSCDQQP